MNTHDLILNLNIRKNSATSNNNLRMLDHAVSESL